MVASAGFGPVLLIGSETLSRFADPDDRSTCILFGDGAGAVVLAPSPTSPPCWPGTSTATGRPPRCWPSPQVGAVSPPPSPRSPRATTSSRWTARRSSAGPCGPWSAPARSPSRRPASAADDLALWIPHQANARIIDATANRLGLPPEKVFVNVDRYGNTSAASVPICLAEAADEGRLHDGDLVMVSGVGAGMSWATALIRWGQP